MHRLNIWLVVALAACSSSSEEADGAPEGDTGAGGTSAGAGGGAARDAAPGTGGKATGGSTGTGGKATGGSTGTGGATGGSTGTGGATGGSTGTGGATGTGGTVIFFDDFNGSSIDTAKWSVFDRISDQVNGEINCVIPSNVVVSGGLLTGTSRYEDHVCGDSVQAPTLMHYTSWQIQQKTAPFLYGTVEARMKLPGGTGIWPTFWMLGYKWQDSQPATANVPGANWPSDGWCETDIAEFWQNGRSQVNCTVHFNVAGGLHIQSLPFDATTRFMVYRMQWSQDSMIWSVDAEDGVGFRTLRSLSGAGSVPNVAQYIVFNAAIGGTGGGTPNPATFPQTFLVDWVRVTQ